MQQGTLRRFVVQQFDNEHGQKCITSTDRILDSRRYRRLVVPQPTPVQEGSLWTARDAKSVDVIALHERLPQLLPLPATTQPGGTAGIQRSVRYTGGIGRIRLHQGGVYVELRCSAHRVVAALIVANSADQHRVRAKTRYMGCGVEWSATYEFAARQQIPQSLSNTDHCRLFHAK